MTINSVGKSVGIYIEHNTAGLKDSDGANLGDKHEIQPPIKSELSSSSSRPFYQKMNRRPYPRKQQSTSDAVSNQSGSIFEENKMQKVMLNTQSTLQTLFQIPRDEWLLALKKSPTHGSLYFNWGRTLSLKETVLMKGKEFTKAKLLRKGISLLSLDEHICCSLANVLSEDFIYFEKDVGEDHNRNNALLEIQKELYLKAIEFNPEHASSSKGLGLIDSQLDVMYTLPNGERMKRSQLLFKSLELNPQDDEVYAALGRCAASGPLTLPNGITVCWKYLLLQAIDLNPHQVKALYFLYIMFNQSNQQQNRFSFLFNSKPALYNGSYGRSYGNNLNIRLLNDHIMDKTELLIEIYKYDVNGYYFKKLLNQLVEIERYKLIRRIPVIPMSFQLRWKLQALALGSLFFSGDSGKEAISHCKKILLWLRKNHKFSFSWKRNDSATSQFCDPKVSFEFIKNISLEYWLEMARKEPQSSGLYCNLARKFLSLGYGNHTSLHQYGYENIRDIFLKSLELDSKNGYVYFYLAETAQSRNYLVELFYLMAIDLNPHESLFYSALVKHRCKHEWSFKEDVWIEFFDGTSLTLQNCLLKAFQLNPFNDQAYTYAGKVGEKIPFCIPTQTLITPEDYYLYALTLNPLNVDAYFFLAQLLDERRKKAQDDHFPHDSLSQKITSFNAHQEEGVLLKEKYLTKRDLLIEATQANLPQLLQLFSFYQITFSSLFYELIDEVRKRAIPRSIQHYFYAYVLDKSDQVNGNKLSFHQNPETILLAKKILSDDIQFKIFSFFRSQENVLSIKKSPSVTTKQSYYLKKSMDYTQTHDAYKLSHLFYHFLHLSADSLSDQKTIFLKKLIQDDSDEMGYIYLAYLLDHDETVILNEESLTRKALHLKALYIIDQHNHALKSTHHALILSSLAQLLEPNEEIELLDGSWMTKQTLCLKALEIDDECGLAYQVLSGIFQSSKVIPKVIKGRYYLSANDLLLQAIALNPHLPDPYYKLGCCLREEESITLLNGTVISCKQLYMRAIQLGSFYPHAYYKIGTMMSDKEKIYLPWNPQIYWLKINLLVKALQLDPTSHFYLSRLIIYLKVKTKQHCLTADAQDSINNSDKRAVERSFSIDLMDDEPLSYKKQRVHENLTFIEVQLEDTPKQLKNEDTPVDLKKNIKARVDSQDLTMEVLEQISQEEFFQMAKGLRLSCYFWRNFIQILDPGSTIELNGRNYHVPNIYHRLVDPNLTDIQMNFSIEECYRSSLDLSNKEANCALYLKEIKRNPANHLPYIYLGDWLGQHLKEQLNPIESNSVMLNDEIYTQEKCYLKAIDLYSKASCAYQRLMDLTWAKERITFLNGTSYTKKELCLKWIEIDPQNLQHYGRLGSMLNRCETIKLNQTHFTSSQLYLKAIEIYSKHSKRDQMFWEQLNSYRLLRKMLETHDHEDALFLASKKSQKKPLHLHKPFNSSF
ncbi:MAG: hypothetical protein QRY72_05680 [Candidatus Rhabdochlamydia sp.]